MERDGSGREVEEEWWLWVVREKERGWMVENDEEEAIAMGWSVERLGWTDRGVEWRGKGVDLCLSVSHSFCLSCLFNKDCLLPDATCLTPLCCINH